MTPGNLFVITNKEPLVCATLLLIKCSSKSSRIFKNVLLGNAQKAKKIYMLLRRTQFLKKAQYQHICIIFFMFPSKQLINMLEAKTFLKEAFTVHGTVSDFIGIHLRLLKNGDGFLQHLKC